MPSLQLKTPLLLEEDSNGGDNRRDDGTLSISYLQRQLIREQIRILHPHSDSSVRSSCQHINGFSCHQSTVHPERSNAIKANAEVHANSRVPKKTVNSPHEKLIPQCLSR
ncbi:hypothetical protein NECAME_07330 [Necator americanus]|uniref:Uncharacterized protein n=1 Tax=Necator americanus TaxID=51031 RepID=W2TRA9_NECAM|nr:hypothetical protein NECAME_07330 [Necator americanus]ETN83572.1 hypothetical protein NECAME_07330 [Necator americanus]